MNTRISHDAIAATEIKLNCYDEGLEIHCISKYSIVKNCINVFDFELLSDL